MSYESSTIATLRRALDEVLLDGRVHGRKSASALEIAEHLLAQAAAGERDLERLKSSAFEKFIGNTERFPEQSCLKQKKCFGSNDCNRFHDSCLRPLHECTRGDLMTF